MLLQTFFIFVVVATCLLSGFFSLLEKESRLSHTASGCLLQGHLYLGLQSRLSHTASGCLLQGHLYLGLQSRLSHTASGCLLQGHLYLGLQSRLSHTASGCLLQGHLYLGLQSSRCFGSSWEAVTEGSKIWPRPFGGVEAIVLTKNGTQHLQTQPECYHALSLIHI
eukprot:TRINITY_DN15035_c0_g1_i2.p1 TRINITY_DN15035_c0_g1~~TRINITY_DN15035_c0_g1_i2.p1  ORF type:complete len:166 (-),score=14.06 TRINITY_DN15035_c0_g1_i2:18-515(-)